MFKQLSLLLLVNVFLVSSGYSNKIDIPIETFTLKNGMKFIVHPNKSIPNANMYIFWKAGSRNERTGITGLAHFFEHMMFNGSKKVKPGEFDKIMEAAGGSNNAYTTQDLTVYTDWFPKASLETVFNLESDRIGYLELDDKMVESERLVVLSERSTGLENSNWRALSAIMVGTAYSVYPYRWPVIGHESDIRNWKKKDLIDFYKTYYSPQNGLVVISGDVDIAKVKSLAEKYIGVLPNGPVAKKITSEEPAQNGEKKFYVVKKSVSSINIMEAYHIPPSSHKDYYALQILGSVLTDGMSSRLYKNLVEKKQMATAVESYIPNSIGPGLFYLYAVASPKTKENVLLSEIHKVLDDIKKKGITQRELQKVKNSKLMELYQTLETINGKSDSLGTYEIYFGSYKELFNAPDNFNKVTAADVQRVANQYFTWKNRTIGVLTSKSK